MDTSRSSERWDAHQLSSSPALVPPTVLQSPVLVSARWVFSGPT